MSDDADRARLARIIIRKGLDRTTPHPELRPVDFVGAWLDGDVRLGELPKRMGLTPRQIERMRNAALDASLNALED